MNIESVISEAIIAIYGSSQLADLLILKGGGAMRMFDQQNTRLSIDADFSIKGALTDPDAVFREMKKCFAARFSMHGFDLIDFRPRRKPKNIQKDFPEWWGGWACEFKLVD
jgi:predicted nucleotidyltransferase component of viral defense system